MPVFEFSKDYAGSVVSELFFGENFCELKVNEKENPMENLYRLSKELFDNAFDNYFAAVRVFILGYKNSLKTPEFLMSKTEIKLRAEIVKLRDFFIDYITNRK